MCGPVPARRVRSRDAAATFLKDEDTSMSVPMRWQEPEIIRGAAFRAPCPSLRRRATRRLNRPASGVRPGVRSRLPDHERVYRARFSDRQGQRRQLRPRCAWCLDARRERSGGADKRRALERKLGFVTVNGRRVQPRKAQSFPGRGGRRIAGQPEPHPSGAVRPCRPRPASPSGNPRRSAWK